VLRDKNIRVEDIKKRDNLSKDKILNRINSQYNYDMSDFAEYYATHNNSTLADLQLEVERVLDKLNEKYSL
jgi:dephospho-CoA kinase